MKVSSAIQVEAEIVRILTKKIAIAIATWLTALAIFMTIFIIIKF
jgi:hypothetical protein